MKNSTCFVLVLLFTLSFGHGISQIDLNLGLLEYFPFNGNFESVVGDSYIINEYDVSFGEDPMDEPESALEFSGEDEFVELQGGSYLNFNSDFCFSLYLKYPENQVNLDASANAVISKWIMDSGHHNNLGYPYTLRVYNQNSENHGKIIFAIYDGNISGCNTICKIVSDQTYFDLKYHHVVFGREDGMLKLYIDCQFIGETEDITDCNLENYANVYLGARNETLLYNYKNNFTGSLDELRIYNRFLNEDEINQLCRTFVSDVSVEEQGNPIEVLDEIDIYPNPFSDYLKIDSSLKFNVYNTLGILVYSGYDDNFDPKSIAKGTYYLHFEDCQLVRKIIKL